LGKNIRVALRPDGNGELVQDGEALSPQHPGVREGFEEERKNLCLRGAAIELDAIEQLSNVKVASGANTTGTLRLHGKPRYKGKTE